MYRSIIICSRVFYFILHTPSPSLLPKIFNQWLNVSELPGIIDARSLILINTLNMYINTDISYTENNVKQLILKMWAIPSLILYFYTGAGKLTVGCQQRPNPTKRWNVKFLFIARWNWTAALSTNDRCRLRNVIRLLLAEVTIILLPGLWT
mgnify:CR=1 FL=1